MVFTTIVLTIIFCFVLGLLVKVLYVEYYKKLDELNSPEYLKGLKSIKRIKRSKQKNKPKKVNNAQI